MKKFLLLLFLFLLSAFIFVAKAQAIDTLTVICSSGCTISGTDPLFSQSLDGYWYPGRTVTKILSLQNSSGSTKEMAMKATKTSSIGDLEKVMQVVITPSAGGADIYTGSLTDFFNQSKISFGNFNSGPAVNYNFNVAMDASANNDYQNTQVVFAMTLGFWTEEEKQNPGGPGDGLSDGRSDGLSDGRSDGMGGFVSTVQPILQRALGLRTEEISASPTPTPTIAPKEEEITKEAKGAKVPCDTCIWWQILLGEVIALFIYYKYVLKKTSFNKKYLIPLLIPLLTYIIFVILNRDCPNYTYIFCKYFWLFDLVLYIVWKKDKKNKVSEKPKPQKSLRRRKTR